MVIKNGVHGSIKKETVRLADSDSGTAPVGLSVIIRNTSSLTCEDDAFSFVYNLARNKGNKSKNVRGVMLFGRVLTVCVIHVVSSCSEGTRQGQ